MRRVLLAIVAVLGMSAAAQANWGTPPAPAPAAPPSGNMYGWNPGIKKSIFWWKKDACGPGGCGGVGASHGGGAGAPASIGGGPQGTLVFPQHPYVRSPRDFFMYGN